MGPEVRVRVRVRVGRGGGGGDIPEEDINTHPRKKHPPNVHAFSPLIFIFLPASGDVAEQAIVLGRGHVKCLAEGSGWCCMYA